MKKRVLSMAVCLVLCVVVGVIVAANRAEVRPMTAAETEKYSAYALTLPAAAPEAILALCTEEGVTEIDGLVNTIYSSDTLAQSLRDCKEITDITECGGSVYITYDTNASEQVSLTYTPAGELHQLVYDGTTDILYTISPSGNEKHLRFREGPHQGAGDGLTAQWKEG